MKSIVNAAVATAVPVDFPALFLGDKGNVWLLDSETSGTVVGTVDGASKPKSPGYRSESLVFKRFTRLPVGQEVILSN